MIIPHGPFQGKEAELFADVDCVRIVGEIDFLVKRDGRIIFPIDYDEQDLRHIYDLLRKPK